MLTNARGGWIVTYIREMRNGSPEGASWVASSFYLGMSSNFHHPPQYHIHKLSPSLKVSPSVVYFSQLSISLLANAAPSSSTFFSPFSSNVSLGLFPISPPQLFVLPWLGSPSRLSMLQPLQQVESCFRGVCMRTHLH